MQSEADDWIDDLFEEEDIRPYVSYLVSTTNYPQDRKDELSELVWSGELSKEQLEGMIPKLKLSAMSPSEWRNPTQKELIKHIRNISQ